MALTQNPSVITLDLEMPRLDGFAFLRLLMGSRPTPVIVISSHGNQENVFRAMELGALDFVAKPSLYITPEIRNIRAEVVQKVLAAGGYNAQALKRLSGAAPVTGMHVVPRLGNDDREERNLVAQKLIAIGASTGGPASLTNILSALPSDINAGILVSQHMPAMFTATFAKRLDKFCALRVVELQGSDIVQKGTVYVAPGDADLVVSKSGDGIRVSRSSPLEDARYTPSVDRMLSTAACVGEDLLAVVLTGMGDDGTAGCAQVYAAGGSVLVESAETAVVNGMPEAVRQSGIPVKQKPLHLMATALVSFAGRG